MMSRRTLLGSVLTLGAVGVAAGLATTAPTSAGSSKPAINQIGSPGVAIKGFDPVAYFTVGKPTKGSTEFTTSYRGAEWRFASAENKATFDTDPEKYVPVYGGYCAYGVAQGYLVKIEGDAWAVRDGKLYLNYDRGVQRTWAKNPDGYIATANKKWTRLAPKAGS